MARELVTKVRGNASIDWTLKESARAQLRLVVKRTRRKYGYPPDPQERAMQLVVEQAGALSQEWAVAPAA